MDAAVFGLIVADLLAEPMDLRRPPNPGGLAVLNSISLATGGNVCNTAIAMAKLGISVAAAGLVGEDILGTACVERLKHAGVDTSAVFVNQQAQTSSSVVAVEPTGERVFFHVPGVTALIDEHVFNRCIPVFAKCKWVQVGYFGLLPTLTPALPTVLAALRKAAPNTQIALDTVTPPASVDLLLPILPHLDLFAPSRSEARVLSGQSDPARMVAFFRKQMPHGLICIKLDSEGCYLDDVKSSVLVPTYKVNVVDTTGAGDTWFGGLVACLIRGMPLEQAGRVANRAAADCCTALGGSAGVRSFDETINRL